MIKKIFCLHPQFRCAYLASFLFALNLNAQGNWIEHQPGGNTLCARGEPFSFFHTPGSSKKIIIDFIGGGACWNAMTCQPGSQTFFDNIDAVREEQKNGLKGLYRKDSDANPFKDWTHIVIPYCSGDVHWGKNDVEYEDMSGQAYTIRHRGAYNAEAVLKWTAKNYAPEDVLITGCSAGAYGSAFWSPQIRKNFPEARLTQFGDSGGGVIPPEFFPQLNTAWKPHLSAPEWIPGVDPRSTDWTRMTLNQYYEAALDADPLLLMSQFHHTNDQIQTFFYELMMGDPDAWRQDLKHSMLELDQHHRFESVLRKGTDHCIIMDDEFLKGTDLEPSVAKWLHDYVEKAR